MTNDELSKQLDEKFAGIDEKFAGIDRKFDGLEKKMDQGFNESKIRDERLEGLVTFGLEAREVLRDELYRRFDAADQKHNEQIGLLRDVIRQNPAKR